MGLLALKLTLAPGLVALATQVAKRLGHRAGGLVGSLPVVAAPVLLILAIERGHAYATEAAGAAVLGVASLALFCIAYGLVAPRAAWPLAVAAGWAAFLAATALFAQTEAIGAWPALLIVVALVLVARPLHERLAHGAVAPPGRTDLWLRLVITAVLVLALTGAARRLDAHVSGLLSPFPIITAVLAGFTHARAGGEAANELLAGFVPGLVSFGLFFAVLAVVLGASTTFVGFLAATATTLAAHAVLIIRAQRTTAAQGNSGASPS